MQLTHSSQRLMGPQMRAHPCEIKHQMRSASHCLNVPPGPPGTGPHTLTNEYTQAHTNRDLVVQPEWPVLKFIGSEKNLCGNHYLTRILKSLKRETL